jgi:hypothetical protein
MMTARRSDASLGQGSRWQGGRHPRLPFILAALGRPVPASLVFVALWGVFLLVLHPWLMNWGSRPDERTTTLPGDTAPSSAYFTRAITVDAPPSAVWPWLLAIGQDRAGFYSYTWLENLTGADIHNADVLRPEWGQRALGDRVPMAGPTLQRLGGDVTLLTLRSLETERVIGDLPGRFMLVPEGDRTTRLLLREPLAIPERSGIAWVVWDPLHFVMEQRMLRGIKERAEARPLVPPAVQASARLGWMLAGVALLTAFSWRRRPWPWLMVPQTATVPALWLAGDPDSALAGFVAVGITVAGALVYGRRWWPPYLLLASGVALVLLLAPDAYAAFGLFFLATVAILAGVGQRRLLAPDAYAAFGFLCLATVVVLAGAELRRLFTTHTEGLQTRADV